MDTLMNQSGHQQAPHSQAGQGMQTIYCSFCSVQLSFPRGSMYIQCPKCQATQNPHAPQQTVCIGCGTLLAHPSNSLYIQCPKCLITMNARENRANVSMPGGSSGTQFNYTQDGNTSFNNKPAKKKKDPNAPKAASNAYMIFCKERRAKLKTENPEMAFGKIGAKLGEIWRNLSPDEKRPYEERAAADRERYRKEMENYKTESESGGAAADELGAPSSESAVKKRPLNELESVDPLVPTHKKVKADTDNPLHTPDVVSQPEEVSAPVHDDVATHFREHIDVPHGTDDPAGLSPLDASGPSSPANV